jgi:hypothetical protein
VTVERVAESRTSKKAVEAANPAAVRRTAGLVIGTSIARGGKVIIYAPVYFISDSPYKTNRAA